MAEKRSGPAAHFLFALKFLPSRLPVMPLIEQWHPTSSLPLHNPHHEPCKIQQHSRTMALPLDQIRATAARVAASHGLDLVDLEFAGSGKHRSLRIFVEKDAAGRARMKEQAEAAAANPDTDEAADPDTLPAPLPKGVPLEVLSGVTHEDCTVFASDFGTVLDVEDLVPGAEYTLEVSSPGLERKLRGADDYRRFTGLLVKLQTFTPVDGNRHFTGRLTAFQNNTLALDLTAVKQKGKNKKGVIPAQTATIDLSNVEKANLVAEI